MSPRTGTSGRMNWTWWLAGAIALAFIATLLIAAATRDRRKAADAVRDLPERTEQPGPDHGPRHE